MKLFLNHINVHLILQETDRFLQRVCFILYPHQQCMRVPVLHIFSSFRNFSLLDCSHLLGGKWYLIICLICIFPMTNDVEHHYWPIICLLLWSFCSSSPLLPPGTSTVPSASLKITASQSSISCSLETSCPSIPLELSPSTHLCSPWLTIPCLYPLFYCKLNKSCHEYCWPSNNLLNISPSPSNGY